MKFHNTQLHKDNKSRHYGVFVTTHPSWKLFCVYLGRRLLEFEFRTIADEVDDE